MDKSPSVIEILRTEDPLSDLACKFLLEYKEEDSHVDYKRDFDPSSEKCWYDLAIDVMAFANTHGGYLIYGVEDKSYRRCGLTEDASASLSDTKVVLEKICRGVQPRYSGIRTKAKEFDGLKYVFIYVPATEDRTHVFERNLDISSSDGKPRTIIRQGSIYVRGSASNQILTADGFDEILNRRVQRFRAKVMEGIARVVHAEPTQEIIVVSPESSASGVTSFRVTDAPDAIAVRGTSLSIVPDTLEDQVAAWISINKADPRNHPPSQSLILVYSQRSSLNLNDDQKYWLSIFSLIQGLPAFYWLRGQSTDAIYRAIEEAFAQAKNPERWYILNVSGFYGKKMYNKYRTLLKKQSSAWVSEFKDLESLFRISKRDFSNESEKEAEHLGLELSQSIDVGKLSRLQKLDCVLYAPFP